jgi:hypothetical protein
MLAAYQVDTSQLPPAPSGSAYGPNVGPSGVSLVKTGPSQTTVLSGLAVLGIGIWAFLSVLGAQPARMNPLPVVKRFLR